MLLKVQIWLCLKVVLDFIGGEWVAFFYLFIAHGSQKKLTPVLHHKYGRITVHGQVPYRFEL
jgi:hypothetical protein